MVGAREDIDFTSVLFATVGGAAVGMAILYSTLLGDTFQSLLSVLPTSIVLVLFQFRKKPARSAKMISEIARNELALTAAIDSWVVFLASGVKVSWLVQSLFIIGMYALLFFLFSYIM